MSIPEKGFLASILKYVWIHKNGAEELKSRPGPKVDDLKIKRKVSPFFLPLPVYLPFIALLSLFCACLHGLEAA